MANQPIDLALVKAYLQNLRFALVNEQLQHAEMLLAHVSELLFCQACTPPPFQFLSAGIGLDPGKKRRNRPNEDFAFAEVGFTGKQEPFGLFLVADGIGGHVNGQEASCLATETIVDHVLPQVREQQDLDASWGELLREGVERANAAIYKRNQQLSYTSFSMGTTVTVALIVGVEVCVANVGDSRTYLQRSGELKQLTHDHSIVAQMVIDGFLKPEDIYTHPQRNVICRSLGNTSTVAVDVFHEQLQDGDRLLLCSDGLWEMLPKQQQIANVLSTPTATAEYMTEKLVQLALEAGGLDNIGLVVVQVNKYIDIAGLQTIIPLGEKALIA
jgi:serine/threonine protein phosphatase PrpC